MGFYWMSHVPDRAGRAGEVIDDIDLRIDAINDIGPDQRETGVIGQVADIQRSPRDEVVNGRDLMTVREQTVA